MAKKRKLQVPLPALKIISVALLALTLGWGAYQQMSNIFTKTSYFKVKDILVDPGLEFINKHDLERLKGINIFSINLPEVQRKLDYKYPQIKDLKVARRFPNQIFIAAKKREPFAQTNWQRRTLTVDEYGVILSMVSQPDKRLPFIEGIQPKEKVALGLPLNDDESKAALEVIKKFKKNQDLSRYNIAQINVTDLSRINCFLSNNLSVIVDTRGLEDKMGMLSLVLTSGQLKIDQVNYLDLRFKEPVIGKKDSKGKTSRN